MTPRAAAFAITVAVAACGTTPPDEPPVCPVARTTPRDPGHPLQCGPTLDLTPINHYEGQLASAQDREGAVALIGGSCTGTLIAAAGGPVVLTAGHCGSVGDQLLVAFNVEDDPDGDTLATGGMIVEQASDPDYALIRLDALPAIAPTLLTTQVTDALAIIQHPRGRPKVIAEGAFLDACSGIVYYTDLDTLVGSSGAGVLNAGGHLLGIHTDGDCAEDGTGSNRGATAAAIVEASPYLQAGDLADR